MSFRLVFWVSLDKYPEVESLGPSLSLVTAFVLMSISSDTSIATPGFKKRNLYLHEIPFLFLYI